MLNVVIGTDVMFPHLYVFRSSQATSLIEDETSANIGIEKSKYHQPQHSCKQDRYLFILQVNQADKL